MVALDGSWPRHASVLRSSTAEIVAAIFGSIFLTSLVIVLRLGVDCVTLTAAELWQIICLTSVAPTVLIGCMMAIRLRQTLTRIEREHDELVSSARIDGLTGLLNRPGFDAVAADTFAETLGSGQPVSALMCDIDAFRGLNDRYGHEAGDVALINLAELLEESMGRRSAILGRHGGDEFAILLPGVGLEEATILGERLCEACEGRGLVHQHPSGKFTISVGVGTEVLGASELKGLLRQTDAALYRAKRAGGNRVASEPKRLAGRQSAPSIERFKVRSHTVRATSTRFVTNDPCTAASDAQSGLAVASRTATKLFPHGWCSFIAARLPEV
jgi:diguanylate cyclase (GGDEF)-like protein